MAVTFRARQHRPLILLGVVLALTLSGTRAFAIDFTSVSAGDWHISANWSPIGVPGAADTVTINHARTTPAFVQTGNVTINSGGSLATGATFQTSGNLTLNGTGTATFGGSVTFNGSGMQTITGIPVFNSSLIIANTAATPSDLACVRTLSAVTVAGQLAVNDGQFSPANGSGFNNISIGTDGILRPWRAQRFR